MIMVANLPLAHCSRGILILCNLDMPTKKSLIGVLSLVFVLIVFVSVHYLQKRQTQTVQPSPTVNESELPSPKKLAEKIVDASQSATPTPKPLTFAEMNDQFGPCVSLPTLMYHHIEDSVKATLEHHANLAVSPDIFRAQLQYLKSHGYQTIFPDVIVNFFDQGKRPANKSIMLTFDDGYDDFYTNVFPLLKELKMNAVLFLPTGLANNPGYLTWNQITEMANSGSVFFANHSWSHKSMDSGETHAQKEIQTADAQLFDHRLNSPKVFAYPYGTTSEYSVKDLAMLGYKLAFTTKHGSTLCIKQRLTLPRIRVGNAALASYGL